MLEATLLTVSDAEQLYRRPGTQRFRARLCNCGRFFQNLAQVTQNFEFESEPMEYGTGLD
jgi:hypothetical protein